MKEWKIGESCWYIKNRMQFGMEVKKSEVVDIFTMKEGDSACKSIQLADGNFRFAWVAFKSEREAYEEIITEANDMINEMQNVIVGAKIKLCEAHK